MVDDVPCELTVVPSAGQPPLASVVSFICVALIFMKIVTIPPKVVRNEHSYGCDDYRIPQEDEWRPMASVLAGYATSSNPTTNAEHLAAIVHH